MRSFGYDNIGFLKYFTSTEWKEIQSNCYCDSKKAFHFFSKDKIIFQRIRGNTFLCNINVPKILNDHNVVLATAEGLEAALQIIEHLWERVVSFPLNLSNAEVRTVHLAYTEDTPFPYLLWKDAFEKPKKGIWIPDYEPKGIYSSGFYFNSSTERLAVYMKDEYLKNRKETMPLNVAKECDHEHIIRIELRIDKLVRKKLADRRLLTQLTLIGADLSSPEGFQAFVKYFQWRVPQFIKGSKAKEVESLSGLQRIMLSIPKDTIKFWEKQCKRGKVQESMLSLATDKILTLEARERPKQLLSGIQKECNLVMKCYEML
jgi:hypothetical protein